MPVTTKNTLVKHLINTPGIFDDKSTINNVVPAGNKSRNWVNFNLCQILCHPMALLDRTELLIPYDRVYSLTQTELIVCLIPGS